MSRSDLWNAVEAKHKRWDAIIARELELALPAELTLEQNWGLVEEFSVFVSNRYKVGVQFDIHAKYKVKDCSKEDARYYSPGDPRNIHAHLMQTACHLDSRGELGNKCLELDPIHCSRAKILNQMQYLRAVWAGMCNSALLRAGHATQIDHRTLQAQGIDRRPTFHLGPSACAIERTGRSSWIRAREVARAGAEKAQAAAEAAAEAKSRLEIESLEKALEDARAIELTSRGRNRQEVESELTPLLTELTRINAFLRSAPNLAMKAPTSIDLAAARNDAVTAAKLASLARRESEILTEELSSLGWWQAFRQGTRKKELEDSRRWATELDERASRVQECAKMRWAKEDIALGVKTQTERKGELVARCQSLANELQAIQVADGLRKPRGVLELGVTKPDPQKGTAQTAHTSADPPEWLDGYNTQDIQADEVPRQEYDRPRCG